MTCFSAKRKSTAYLDGRLRNRETLRVTDHLSKCDPCASYFDQIGSLRSGLQNLAPPAVPVALGTKLRVIASRERHTLLETRGSRLRYWWTKWTFRLDQLMRPLTIPATGGLLSSLLLFATLGFAIGTTTRSVAYEVPVVYEDRAGANLVPISVTSAVLLSISLDGKGHIQDYVVRDGEDSFAGNPGRLVYNNIVLPQFPTRAVRGDISILLTPIVFRQ